jgi:4-amino-4-deoxy-L-arabinose transferase-like glycosyltransferase
MTTMPRAWLTAGVLAVAAFALYSWQLQSAPLYLSPDEVIIAVDAHALASTGRDVYGRFLPLYFQIQMPGETRMGWFTPAIFYVSALYQRVLPLSEWAIRLPTVCVAVVDVVLIYVIGLRLFRREALAIIAAVLLALTPAHFILSRYALDYVYPLPFVLGWLLCLLTFLDEGRQTPLFVGCVLLGAGFFSYIGSMAMMPLYFAITVLLVGFRRDRLRLWGLAAAGFGLPLLMLVPWLIAHPTAFRDTVARYDLYDTQHLNALQGLRAFFSYPNLDRLASLYWSFLNPSFLFFSGDRLMTFSTRSVGVFTLPMAALLPLGVYHVCVLRRTLGPVLIVVGFVTAPLAALLGAEDAAIIRAVELMPFAVLLAVYGLEYLWSVPVDLPTRALLLPIGLTTLMLAIGYGAWTALTASRLAGSTLGLLAVGGGLIAAALFAERVSLGRLGAVCLLALVPLQFGSFARDYFTDYRLRSSSWLGGNLRGALEGLIDIDRRLHPPRIYFSTLRSSSGLMDTRNRWMDAYWKFYLIKHRREDLLARTASFDPASLQGVAPGSIVLANVGDVATDSLLASGDLKMMELVPELGQPPFFAILERR